MDTRKLYQQTLEHILILFKRAICEFFHGTQMITVLTIYSSAHYMFGVQHYLDSTLITDCCLHSQMSPLLEVGISPDNRTLNLKETRPDDVKKMSINLPQEKFRRD